MESVSDKHALAFCAEGNTSNEAEEYFASTSEAVSGYKLFIDCSHAINSYYPDRKSEYFGIQHISTGVGVGEARTGEKYYIDDNEKYVVGTPKILGVLDNYIFINYCYEGCGSIKMLDLKLSSPDCKVRANILRCNIYSLKETQDNLGRKPIDEMSIEVK